MSDAELGYHLDVSAESVGEAYPVPEVVEPGPSQNQEPGATMEDVRSIVEDESMQHDDELPRPIVEDVDMETEDAYQRQDPHVGDGNEVPGLVTRPYMRARSIASSTSEFSQLPYASTAQEDQSNRLVPSRTYRILYVPDPSRARSSLREAEADLGYTTRSMPKEDFEYLKSLVPEYIYIKRSQLWDDEVRGGVEMRKVRMSEWVSLHRLVCRLIHPPILYQLWIMYRLSLIMQGPRHLFTVSYMDWKRFKVIMVSRIEDDLQSLFGYDCIAGGIDYTIDFR